VAKLTANDRQVRDVKAIASRLANIDKLLLALQNNMALTRQDDIDLAEAYTALNRVKNRYSLLL
jgi:hypothetical protein